MRDGTRVDAEDVATRQRVHVIIDRAAPHTARFGDPLAVDNAYSLLTYIVIGARSRPLAICFPCTGTSDRPTSRSAREIPENSRGARQ